MRVGRGRWRRKRREGDGESRKKIEIRKGVKGRKKWRMRKGKKIEKRQLNKLLKNHYKVKSHNFSTG